MSIAAKTRVNLFSPSLLPPKLLLSFKRMNIWAGAFVVLALLAFGASYWFLEQTNIELEQMRNAKRQLDEQKSQLEQELNARVPDQKLEQRAKLEQQQLDMKRLLLGELSQREALTSQGYSQLLTELAQVSDSSVWLERIQVQEQEYHIQGYSQHPEGVPLWLEKLKTTDTFKGQAFSTMSMNRGENKPLAFTLTSSLGGLSESEGSQ